jgi:hypothetical protein
MGRKHDLKPSALKRRLEHNLVQRVILDNEDARQIQVADKTIHCSLLFVRWYADLFAIQSHEPVFDPFLFYKVSFVERRFGQLFVGRTLKDRDAGAGC